MSSNHTLISRRRLLASALAATAIVHLPAPSWGQSPSKKQLQVRSESPFNAEPALAELVKSHVTPLAHFYVRNHGGIPELDAKNYTVKIDGLVHKPLTLSLAELQDKFKSHSAEATLTCAGNRRMEMSAIKKVGGVQWDAGAIGNAQWQGALLADLLKAAELKEGARHVWFEGLDPVKEKDGSEAPFGGSIPLEKALVTDAGIATLAAWNMNEEQLQPEHGFPLRMVVPGYIGARSVKWLSKITVSDRPSPNHYVAEAYKIIKSEAKEEVASADPIYEYIINAAICKPASGAAVKKSNITVSGYALPAGDPKAMVEKVELSTNGGKSWETTKLHGEAKPMVWRLWSHQVDLAKDVSSLIVRATDSRGNTQPETSPWNLKGYLYNGWHSVKV